MNKIKVSAHNLGQIGGKRDRATEACYRHIARSDGEADSQDGLKCEQLPSFYSKILLFGEYSIMLDSMALSTPYSLFEGKLVFRREIHSPKDAELSALAQYLKNLENTGELDFPLDTSSLAFDIGRGLQFDSSIPRGHGLGSSGALSAAIYHHYATTRKNNREHVIELKRRLATVESHFHGSSSGIDPLISYLDHPLLIGPKGDIKTIQLPRANEGQGAIFLLDTGRSRQTEPLVHLFLEKCKSKIFMRFCERQLLPTTNACIHHFLLGDMAQLENAFRQLSSYQWEHFRPMIPKLYHEVWQCGLDTGDYSLKLCGAGGGGLFLGMTSHFKQMAQHLSTYETRPLFRFNTK